jgi:hypothetical protein
VLEDRFKMMIMTLTWAGAVGAGEGAQGVGNRTLMTSLEAATRTLLTCCGPGQGVFASDRESP